MEEAFCNAVKHFSGMAADEERIHVDFYIEDSSLVVSIREKGIPFDRSEAERYTPDSMEGMNRPGLGMLLMHEGVDSVELFVHGREGKETRLTKRIGYGSLPEELANKAPAARGAKRITVREPEVRLAESLDLPEVSRLDWRCYGYTQEAFLYDVEALTRKVEAGEFKSVVGVDPESGALIGHAGFKYHDPSVKVPELGLVFVDPAYRSPRLGQMMTQLLFDMARSEGARGIFDASVTTHIFSQKGLQERMGSRPCCLMLGIAASGMQAKELATSRQEKGTTINHYFALDKSPHTVFVSERHAAMVRDIYDWLDLPRTFGAVDSPETDRESQISIFPLPDELNVSFIIVHAIGKDTAHEVAEGLRDCRNERKDAVYAFLPLGDPASPRLVDDLESLGFFFSGIMPHIHDGDDRILLQYVDIPLNMDAIRVYGEMSASLFAYVQRERQRALNLL